MNRMFRFIPQFNLLLFICKGPEHGVHPYDSLAQ